MQMRVAFDTSMFIERSIELVYKVMAEALLLVVLVIFLFLRSLRATLIPFVTIPVSLIGAFFFLIWIGLLDQRADAARHRARGRPGGRRRHRGAGEHPPPHRGRHDAA
jgi:hypothetical protein